MAFGLEGRWMEFETFCLFSGLSIEDSLIGMIERILIWFFSGDVGYIWILKPLEGSSVFLMG